MDQKKKRYIELNLSLNDINKKSENRACYILTREKKERKKKKEKPLTGVVPVTG